MFISKLRNIKLIKETAKHDKMLSTYEHKDNDSVSGTSSLDPEDPNFSEHPGNFQHYEHPLPLNYWTYTPTYMSPRVQSFVSCLHGISALLF